MAFDPHNAPTADRLIEVLGLTPLEPEGGWYRETWRSREALSSGRPAGTAILYLLTPDTFSAFHRLDADEIYHFHAGDPVTQVHLHDDGSSQVLTLGEDLAAGHRPRVVVPAGTWQGTFLDPGGRFALMGTTMTPGFMPDGYEAADRRELVERFADRRELVLRLTR
ncbi:MAG: cupin domain-containing protein [Deltaproteobacteria bacterium]|nr:cupin domain-containing protein [Deltaproteobacteria bacterium]